MARALQGLQWLLLAVYAAAGAVALLISTPSGLRLLGQTDTSLLSFLPAKILGLPWSLPLWFMDDGPITAFAVLGICYAMNVGVGLMLARSSRG